MPVNEAPRIAPTTGMSQETATFLGQVTRWAQVEMGKLIPRNEGVNGIILISPSQKSYMVTVSDTGVLTTTLMVPGKLRP